MAKFKPGQSGNPAGRPKDKSRQQSSQSAGRITAVSLSLNFNIIQQQMTGRITTISNAPGEY